MRRSKCHPLQTISTSVCSFTNCNLYINLLLTCHKQQSKISNNAGAALLGLRGNNWGQHGDVVFFLQGTYHDKENVVKTFK